MVEKNSLDKKMKMFPENLLYYSTFVPGKRVLRRLFQVNYSGEIDC